ncbi:MAG: cupin domain-containing protein [Vicinamibacteria bacterium]
MNPHQKLAHPLSGTIALLAVVWGTVRPVEATPASGVTFTVLSRATVPEFDARRRFRQESKDTDRHRRKGRNRSKTWKIELEATRMIDVVTVLFTVQPGGHGGWHTHPGPALFTVSAGTLTMYEGDDPSCEPQLFPAGTGSVEAEDSGHIHMLRNETGSVAETIVTFLVPVGALLRTDLPDPGTCPF